METKREMTASALVELLRQLDQGAIPICLDGGWGVDALLERQSRPHADVDIILRLADVPRLKDLLGRLGFTVKEGAPPNSFVLSDHRGLEVDVHAVVFDADGNGVYRMTNGQDWVYPAEGFGGHGAVNGARVRCLSQTAQVLCHANGYAPISKDIHDMELLRERFGVELPPQLTAFSLDRRTCAEMPR